MLGLQWFIHYYVEDYYIFDPSVLFHKKWRQILADDRYVNDKQLSHRILRSPDGFILDYHLYSSGIWLMLFLLYLPSAH